MATLEVTKSVVGDGPAGPYSFTAACTLRTTGGPTVGVPLTEADAAFTLSDGQKHVIVVPRGADCVVQETNVGALDTVDYGGSSDPPTVTVDGPATLAVTNTFPAAPTPSGGGSTGGSAGGSVASGAGSGLLPRTGADVARSVLLALALVGGGGGLLLLTRSRRRRA